MPANNHISKGKTPHSVRLDNYRLLLRFLKDRTHCTIGEISSELGLSKITIGKILQSLKDKNVVIIKGKGNSTDIGGKRPELYEINKSYKYGIVFYSFNEKTIGCKVFDLQKNIVYETLRQYERRLEYEEAISEMAALYNEVMSYCKISAGDLYGIILSSDGIVDCETGVLCNPITFYYWGHNKPLKKDFIEKAGNISAPVFMDNISRYTGYAELMCAGNKQYESMAIIYNNPDGADGIGGCIIQNRKLQHGFSSCLGEFGHIVVDKTVTKKCRCGSKGCFEQVASLSAVLDKAKNYYLKDPTSELYEKAMSDSLVIDEIIECANNGEVIACQVLDEIADIYAWIINNIMIIANPEVVVLQGLFSRNGEYFFQTLNEKLYNNPFIQGKRMMKLKKSECPWDKIEDYLQGAVQYAIDQFFEETALYE